MLNYKKKAMLAMAAAKVVAILCLYLRPRSPKLGAM